MSNHLGPIGKRKRRRKIRDLANDLGEMSDDSETHRQCAEMVINIKKIHELKINKLQSRIEKLIVGLEYINCNDDAISGKWVTAYELRDKAKETLEAYYKEMKDE